jgi:hypothetical protein
VTLCAHDRKAIREADTVITSVNNNYLMKDNKLLAKRSGLNEYDEYDQLGISKPIKPVRFLWLSTKSLWFIFENASVFDKNRN